MNFRYLVFSGLGVWGKTTASMTKEYFANAAKRGDLIVDLEEGKYFDKDYNAWKDVEGDK